MKKCACCDTSVQSNIKLKWKRDSDGIIFHICCECAERGFDGKELKISKQTIYKEETK